MRQVRKKEVRFGYKCEGQNKQPKQKTRPGGPNYKRAIPFCEFRPIQIEILEKFVEINGSCVIKVNFFEFAEKLFSFFVRNVQPLHEPCQLGIHCLVIALVKLDKI